ncbi:aminotransferase class I/II-fold pyridoxal phosphate-dependent enzyme [Exiguobacterium sp. s144]|uniref:aminotransferase class I/II-fold pyridoxal phosphate-dependent enzyme n=1 Tax=Exiguobacterium sp. s144 TaxID=2751195 RepID=UPI001BE7B4AE|nr:aminotransferase class I/II-fold pyridoxal phosphate-dependent enzyme [Exiguobacterium sp. s144]
MTDNKRILLSSPHMSGNETKYINEAFETNWIAPLGKNVDEFEREVAEYVGSKNALALSSGTAAIHLALRLLEIEQDDLVFCSTFTFVATANPILYEKATPIFIDSEPDTWNMSPVALKKAFEYALQINKMPKAVIVVHLYGQSAKMDEIMEICEYYNVPIIEDSAESLGSVYKTKKSGTHGLFGIYSFNGNKIITTSGGGMLISDNDELMQKARFLATQARDDAPYYEHSQLGFNYRLSNISAGIGRGQLEVLNDRINSRRANFDRYKNALSKIDGIDFMPEMNDTFSNRWLSAILIDPIKLKTTPLEIVQKLNSYNIEARLLWKPMHLQPLFKGTICFDHYENGNFSEQLFANGICLPSGSNLQNEEIKKVISHLSIILETANTGVHL